MMSEAESSQEEITAAGNPSQPQGEAGAKMLARMNESHAEVILFEGGTELRQFVGMMMCTRHPHGFHVVVDRQFGGCGSWVYDKCFHLFVIFRAVIRL